MRTKAQAALELADEIEELTVPVPKDLMLLKNDRALIVEALRFAASHASFSDEAKPAAVAGI